MMQTSLRKALSTMNLGQIGFLCGNASAAKAKMVSQICVETCCVHHPTLHVSTCVSTHLEISFVSELFVSKRTSEAFIIKKVLMFFA
jgi:hypothetical protein